jgi:drug/metabolite transporter (DMT)-like permease
MNPPDFATLIHPAIAVAFIFPLLGMVVNFAWQTRQRRLKTLSGEKSSIPPVVGKEHLQLGKRFTAAVVGICLLGLTIPTLESASENQAFAKQPTEIVFLGLMFVATIASLIFLYRSRTRLWRVIFTILTSLGILVIGFQDILFNREQAWIYRRDDEWQVSHFYYGILVTLLMIFSLAIVEEIYRDRSNRWRLAHIILNCFALLLFIGQGMTGTRDLLEIPLSWQEDFIYQCDFTNKTCPQPQPQSQIPINDTLVSTAK